MWRPRRTFKGVMRWRMKDPPDLAMRCRFAPWQEKCEKEKRLRILPDAPGLLADDPFPIDHIIARSTAVRQSLRTLLSPASTTISSRNAGQELGMVSPELEELGMVSPELWCHRNWDIVTSGSAS